MGCISNYTRTVAYNDRQAAPRSWKQLGIDLNVALHSVTPAAVHQSQYGNLLNTDKRLLQQLK